ncbi:uncharacterized protein EV420DRAFT_1709185 [Desarmillaria tabescens]|uniref:Uncharacterized protein n=1 Tax=Armillaria tabescens TaxID=1929756 RepID=A0AA39U2S2_ARMTA|nr:uncharacterized protein EV420DRAFT_1709185 [Desarmillaria tabescens]KAK0465885.1 hypothetical protein EV420DRAFT_1709185 [Desarmillaria tabescens]
MALTVIESLINVTRLSLGGGEWHRMPDSVVSSLQSRSYHVVDTSLFFHFRSIGEIFSLVKNSPDLQELPQEVTQQALYSLTLILHVIFYAREDVTLDYFDSLGIAPHSLLDVSQQATLAQTIHGKAATCSGGQNSQQNSFTMSDDLEGHEREDEHAHHTLKGSREDTVNKIVVCRDGPEVRLERLGDSQFISGTVVYEDDIENV